jgi:hypothetical protein
VIAGLDRMLETRGQPGLPALRSAVERLLGGRNATGRLVTEEKLLRSRVYRIAFEIGGATRSFVVKRLSPTLSHRERLVVTRWLPRVGMSDSGPPLLTVAAEETGTCMWHVYADVGTAADTAAWSPSELSAVLETVARIHRSFEAHALLGECRAFGGDFGPVYYAASVRDAIRGVEAVEIAEARLAATCDGLLAHLYRLLDEEAERLALVRELAGPETLVHGDLWTANVLVRAQPDGVQVRLIDWDHAGVGPATFDLSTFLFRFPLEMRADVVERYREAGGFVAGSLAELDRNLDTAERARLANCAVWAAASVLETGADWAEAELAEVAEWFDALEPVLLVPAVGARTETAA